jgi:hypothetical protein
LSIVELTDILKNNTMQNFEQTANKLEIYIICGLKDIQSKKLLILYRGQVISDGLHKKNLPSMQKRIHRPEFRER